MGRWRSRWWVAVVGVVAAASVALWFTAGRAGQQPAAADVRLPPLPERAAPTLAHLRGAGRPLVRLHIAVASLLERDLGAMTDAQCRRFATRHLADLGTPVALARLAHRTPDRATGQMLANQLGTVVDALGACGQAGSTATRAQHDLRYSYVIVARRLRHLGMR